MRKWIGLLLAMVFVGAGCETIEERDEPDRIPRAEAIRIATSACREFPRIYPNVSRVRWEKRDNGYWVVDITDPSETYGKFYMINRRGRVVGVGKLPLGRNYNLPRPYAGEYPGGPIYEGRVVY